MGEYAELAIEHEICQWFDDEILIERYVRNNIWVTNDLREIPISNMTDRHLKNTIRMLESGRAGNRMPWYNALIREKEKRDEIRSC